MDELRGGYADKRRGRHFKFGRYPQGSKGEIKPLTWLVLRCGRDHLLAIAESGLDCKPYNEKQCSVDWSVCTLRRWLNEVFFIRAFDERERSLILPSRLDGGADSASADRVFLLSLDEAESLFAKDAARRAAPTDFAAANGVYKEGSGACFWWLRSRGDGSGYAACVDCAGGLGGCNLVFSCGNAVRPALRLAL